MARTKPKRKKTTAAKKSTKAKKKPRVSTHPAKQRTPESRALVEKVRKVCTALPDVTEVIAWGEPTWRTGGRIFAQFDDHHHGGEHVSIWLPAPDGAQAALIEAEPEHIWRPPYVGHAGWIAVKLDTDPEWGMVEMLVAQAHELIAAKARPKRSAKR
jgi:hypothetical protein